MAPTNFFSPNFAEKLRIRDAGLLPYPEKFIPEYIFGETCEHKNLYDYRDENLILLSEDVTIYSEKQEEILKIPMYGRPTEGSCSCVLKPDTHEHLLHNISTSKSGRFLSYSFLISVILAFVNGKALNNSFDTRLRSLKSIGMQCSLNIKTFTRAVIGFASNIKFLKTDWMCEFCGAGGDTPRYLVCDGKQVGPTKKRVKHLKELGVCNSDQCILQRGSHSRDRIFLARQDERDLVKSFLKKETTLPMLSNLVSDNGHLVRNLLIRVHNSFGEIPVPYEKFIKDLCKGTGVNGLLQCTNNLPLQYLSEFCAEELDLRSPEQSQKVLLLQKELPVLWDFLIQILKIDVTSRWLPRDLASILREMLTIRESIFDLAPHRNSTQYVDWPDRSKEHPTMHYPNWPIFRYLSNYNIRNTRSVSDCTKHYGSSADFTGIFSAGCCCSLNITHGFELLCDKEGPHNLFRLLQTRDLDFSKLEGVVYDNACNFDDYLLNREPRDFPYLRTLVDGAHWENHKGCSQGYNSKNYRNTLPRNWNTQGREQVHSLLEQVSSSFRQTNYFSFMTLLRVFFGLTNLKNKKLI